MHVGTDHTQAAHRRVKLTTVYYMASLQKSAKTFPEEEVVVAR